VDLVSAAGRVLTAAALAILAVAVAAATGLAAREAGSAPAASRVLDRTYTCTASPFLSRRWIVPFAQPGVREFGSTTDWHSLATVSLHTGTNYDDTTVMSVGAGFPEPTEGVHGVTLNRQLCRTRAPRIPLSSRGLVGGPVAPLGEQLKCRATAKVVVRIRALFVAPTSLRPGPFGMSATSVPVTRAAIAVRTKAGKPLVFAEVFASGRARLFTGRGCTPR
jgi:hypothetical protein